MATDSARMEVVQCERDIQSIKAALRQVASAEDESKPNSLEVVWTGMEGMDATDDTVEVSLQLSSPVEEATLTSIRKEGEEAGPLEVSSVSFAGVESSMATLAITLRSKKDGLELGTSEAFDLAPICSLGDSAMNPKEEYVTILPAAIIALGGGEENKREEEFVVAASSEEKPSEEKTEEAKTTDDDAAAKEEETSGDNKETSEETKAEESKAETESATETPSPTLVMPLCTLSLKLVFKPSAKDQKEALYELLNKASLRRSQALERHRGEQQSAMTTKPASPTKKPAVKAGFLNKKAKKAEESKIKQFYDKYLGPQSLGRGVIFPIAKNYIIFFGAVVLCHFKGQELALPAPV